MADCDQRQLDQEIRHQRIAQRHIDVLEIAFSVKER